MIHRIVYALNVLPRPTQEDSILQLQGCDQSLKGLPVRSFPNDQRVAVRELSDNFRKCADELLLIRKGVQ